MKNILLFLSAAAVTTTGFAEQIPEPNPPVLHQSSPVSAEILPKMAAPSATETPSKEWLLHKTLSGDHPSNAEQRMMWLMNRARKNPHNEGVFLANIKAANVKSAISYFNVNLTKLQAEFDSYAAKPPAAFDRRLYNAALTHSKDLIARDAQDHNNQFEQITSAGFRYTFVRGSVFSYAEDALYAHAGFNIDWGFEADGMQTGRGHRAGIMSLDDGGNVLTNAGIAAVPENNSSTSVGPLVVTINYANANTAAADHYNRFLVGTVWRDKNGNGVYEGGEGLAGVQVRPSIGTYWATTAKSGGYAIPATTTGIYTVTFSGGALGTVQKKLSVTVSDKSVLLDLKLAP